MAQSLSKQEARAWWKRTRGSTNPVASERLRGWVASDLRFQTAPKVALFCARPGEPDLLGLWNLRPDACVFPKVESGSSMGFYRVPSLDALTPGYAGILEPSQGVRVDDWGLKDWILVPGAAFDRFGGRVGSGKGYYDRFLCSVLASPCGICWDSQIVGGRLAQEPTDARMQTLCTESGIRSIE